MGACITLKLNFLVGNQTLEWGSLVWSAESAGNEPSAHWTLWENPGRVSLDLLIILRTQKLHYFLLRLQVKEGDLKTLMEGMSLSDALGKKKLFMVNLQLMQNIPCKEIMSKVNLLLPTEIG